MFQAVQDAFGFDLDPRVTCGNATYDTSERMLSFLDEKLRGEPAQPEIDANCFVQDDDHGIVTDAIPIGGERYSIAATQMSTGPVLETVANALQGLSLNGALLDTILDSLDMTAQNLFDLLDSLASNPEDLQSILTNDVLQLLPPELLNELTAPSREIFLFSADREMTLAGIPTADLTVSPVADTVAPIVFVGLGVRHDPNERIELINDQIAPLRGSGEFEQQLVGVTQHLQAGDEVYLMLYGFHNQYYLSFNRVPQVVTLSGDVRLPLFDR